MRSRKLTSFGVVLCATGMFWGCGSAADEGGADAAGASSNLSACVPVDTIDTVPDHVDEDCDGKFDEDADAKPSMCPKGSNIIVGTRGDDTLYGTNKRDCILGYGGNDTILGGNGNDVIYGGAGDDNINGGNGRDMVFAGKGNDYVDAANGGDAIVYGDDGQDTLLGGNGVDSLFGGDGNDVIIGGKGPDLMQGGDCNDLIIGEHGPDVGIGNGGYDACEAELAIECEVRENNKVDCQHDSDCSNGGHCAENVHYCVPANRPSCNVGNSGPTCTPTAATDTTCDGVDDDCDGTKDEDFAPSATACGVGACHAVGQTACVLGAVVDTCMAGAPAANDASCNGVDDDCNGLVDDGYVSLPTSCGVGACGSTGNTQCVGGQITSSCTPGTPASCDTTCDGIDDDCNGQVDDGYVPEATSCGVGACASNGVTSCVGGSVLNSCQASAPAPDDSTCNGVDDDCDGTADEDFVAETTFCGAGACAMTGNTSCNSGVVFDSCTVFCEGACGDMTDDDHDGNVDCSDNDCASDPACAGSPSNPYIGLGCTSDSDCGPGGACETALPGGYCYVACDFSQPSGHECPGGATCWLGSACVKTCDSGSTCSDPRLTCGDYSAAGLPPEQFCHPTCMESCVNGGACDPATQLCF